MTTPDAIARVEEAVGFLEYMREEDLADAVSETARELKEARAALTFIRDMPSHDQDDIHRLRHAATAVLARIDEVMPTQPTHEPTKP